MNAPETFALQISRFIKAPRDKVFEAFTSAEVLPRWHCPRGMEVASASVDARVGGNWRIDMRARSGFKIAVYGQYRAIERPGRLVYTWRWDGAMDPAGGVETLIELTLTERDGGTEVQMQHSGFLSAPAREGHTEGWNSVLNRLTDLLDARGSAATLTLMGDPRSSYVRTVRMALAEKGVAYTLQPCAPHSPELLALHPFGRMPALRDGVTPVFETSAILRYVDECFNPEVSFTPDTIHGRVLCEQWSSAIKDYVYDTMIRRFVLPFVFPRAADGKPDRSVIDGALAQMPAQLAALEAAYKGLDYLAGGALSGADLLLAPILASVQAMPEGARLLEAYPEVRRAQAIMQARPSFSAAHQGVS